MAALSPPRIPRWLLERILPPGVRGDSIRGDLLEEMSVRAAQTSPRAARRWYWAQASRIALDALVRRGANDTSTRRAPLMDSLSHDLKFAARSLLKARGFTVTAVLTLALGIGAATAVFSVVNAVQLRPLPYAEPHRLMWITEAAGNGSVISIAWPDFLDWRERATAFEELAAIRRGLTNLTAPGEPERLVSRYVNASFLQALGVRPALGRMFTADEDRVGAPRVVLIGDGLWRRRFNADRQVVGTTITLDGQPHEIIGVLPAGFSYNLITDDDVLGSLGQQAVPESGLLDRGNHNGLSAIGRLRAGVTEAAARSELDGIAAALRQAHPATNANTYAHLEPLAQRLIGDVTPMLMTLLGAVAVLMLLATVNVASLLVTRGVARQHELAVRAALGCGRWRLMRQLLVESALLALAGGLAGIALAAGLIQLFLATAPDDVPRLASIRMDATVWGFALAVSAAAALLLGALPGVQSSGLRGQSALVRAGRGNTPTRSAHRMRRLLMVVEVALAIVLVTGAGLMTRTMFALAAIDPGFDSSSLLTMRVNVTGDRSSEALQRAFDDRLARFGDDVLTRVRSLPGVEHAALAMSLPIEGSQWGSIFIVADQPVPAREALPIAAFQPVSAGYFETLRMRLRAGRFFDAIDAPAAAKTAIVNESFARRFWPNESAIGKRLKQSWPEEPTPWREIVGVVNDVKVDGVEADTPLQVYLPYPQEPNPSIALIVRSSTPPASLARPIAAAIHAIEPMLPVFGVQTMNDMMRAAVTRRTMTMVIFGGFAIVALVLASVGLYGVISQGVVERTREVGVRMALGATRPQVIRLFLRQGAATTAIGVVIGIVSAMALARLVEDLLFHVAPTDPLAFWSAIAALMIVSTAACYIPARRAARVRPTIALRAE
ncbi:MAG TPA: ADOP family duplicated permease [Vicinamibacterales bacterium]|nr:ADOP family duplicated permease [Vicinamibacterales bacterium]